MVSTDYGSTVTYDSGVLAPAGGNYGSNVINSSAGIGSTAVIFTVGEVSSEFGPTILYPASAVDAIVKASIKLYKLRGFYSAGSIFEVWVTNDPNSTPPSGHILTNISVVDTWTV